MSIRLKYGLFWARNYPSPADYKTQSRFVMALLLILFMLWLAMSRLDFEAALAMEQVSNEATNALATACATQAHLHDTSSEKMNIGWVVDGKLVAVNCEVISREAKANIRSM